MKAEELDELARLYTEHVTWLEAHPYSSEYSEPRAALAMSGEQHMPALIASAREAARLGEENARLRAQRDMLRAFVGTLRKIHDVIRCNVPYRINQSAATVECRCEAGPWNARIDAALAATETEDG